MRKFVDHAPDNRALLYGDTGWKPYYLSCCHHIPPCRIQRVTRSAHRWLVLLAKERSSSSADTVLHRAESTHCSFASSMRIQLAHHSPMVRTGTTFSPGLAVLPISTLHHIAVPWVVRFIKARDAGKIAAKASGRVIDRVARRKIEAPGIAVDADAVGCGWLAHHDRGKCR